MVVDVYVPVLAALVLGAAVRPLTGLLAPVSGVRMLVGAGVLSAVSWVWTLGLLAWTAVGQFPQVARFGGWSTAALRAESPVALPVGYGAVGLLVAVIALFALVSIRRLRAVGHSWNLARALAPTARGELVVLPDPAVEAFALPGFDRRRRGHIVVTAGMLRALEAPERRVLFAHERAHLTGGHHWWLLAAQLAAAANPFLTRLPATVDYLLERAADEAAATAVGDRRLAARALARAGLAALHQPPTSTGRDAAHGIALGYTTSAVPARVSALLAAPPAARRGVLAALTVAVLLVVVAAVDAGLDLEALFEIAMRT